MNNWNKNYLNNTYFVFLLPAFHHFVRKRLGLQTRETDTDDCSQNELQSMISETDLNNESSSFDGWYFFSIIKFRLVRFYILWFFIIIFISWIYRKKIFRLISKKRGRPLQGALKSFHYNSLLSSML